MDKVIAIDQTPIGRTPRSNPATYTGAFACIPEMFSLMPEARARGYRPGRFSFNVKGGRCEACQGGGVRTVEMHLLPDVYVRCEACKGRRYNRETLEVLYRGRTIADVLDMTVSEAHAALSAHPRLDRLLLTLMDVGLGYVRLGQSATTLSGGEAQRVKLARELGRRDTGRTLYILDEPTTGLHFDDVKKLLDVLNRLADLGNTVLVIEHHLDVIKQADWIIDLGPEAGAGGGQVVAAGTPEEVAACARATPDGSCGRCSPTPGRPRRPGRAVSVPRRSHRRRPAAGLAAGVPHPRAHDLSGELFPGRHAQGRRQTPPAGSTRRPGHAGRARLGRGLVAHPPPLATSGPHHRRAPGSVVMHQNVSICQSVILSCFDLSGRRNKIVYEDRTFPP